MARLNQIFVTALALQGARTAMTDIRGVSETPEGQEFAKAIAVGLMEGATPEKVTSEVTKAMCGDEILALALLQDVQTVAKAHVEAHTREAGGKVISVHAYETARQKAMEGSNTAAAATLMALRSKTPEAHENAAAAHEEASKGHASAHEGHPTANEDAGIGHAKAREIHTQQADLHRQTANDLRQGEEYQRAAQKALTASKIAATATNHASQAGTSGGAIEQHMKAADAHRKAAELNPGKGHEVQAEKHDMEAKAATAFDSSTMSPHRDKAKYDAQAASAAAYTATRDAHQGDDAKTHLKASEAHKAAAEAHMALHGKHESSEDAHHGKIARKHIDLSTYHAQKAKPTVAKADGAEAHMGHDLAKQTGTAAMLIEGRPDEKLKDGTIAKAHVEQHTREVGGKVVQVASYETHQQAAMKASAAAHTATSQAQTPEQHTAAAASHMKTAEAHREAGKYAPESWMEKGHEDQAKLHEAYAQAHHAKAKAAGNRADTGVDQPPHTPQDIENLEQHPDYQGFGYLGHPGRDAGTDIALAQAAQKSGIKPHELAAHVLGKSGRHMMDKLPPSAQVEEGKEIGKQVLEQKHTERVAHFQKWLTDPKNKKEYDIEGYGEQLRGANPREQGDDSKPTVVPKKAGASGAATSPSAKPKPAAAAKPAPAAQPPASPETHKKLADLHMAAGDAFKKARNTPSKENHAAAAEAHQKLAAAHREAGNAGTADKYDKQAAFHTAESAKFQESPKLI